MTDYLTNLANRVLAPDPAIRPVDRLFFPEAAPALSSQSNPDSLTWGAVDLASPSVAGVVAPSLAVPLLLRAAAVENAGSMHPADGLPHGSSPERTGSRLDDGAANRPHAATLPSGDPADRSDQGGVRWLTGPEIGESVRSRAQPIPAPLLAAQRPQPAPETGSAPPARPARQPEPPALRPDTDESRAAQPIPPPLLAAQRPQPAQETGSAPPARPARQPEPPALRPAPTETMRLAARQAEPAAAPPPVPVIQISIGRVEVRAVAPATQSRSRPPAPQPPGLSLEDYLKQHA